MGSGASTAVAQYQNATEEELKAVLRELPEESRSKLAAACKMTASLVDVTSKVDAALVKDAKDLDASDTNRSNVKFSRAAINIAKCLAGAEIAELEKSYESLAEKYKKGGDAKPPFALVEGVKYAGDAAKFAAIEKGGLVIIVVPFFCEFERGTPATAENPNGEESPIQKIEECVFLLDAAPKMSIKLLFVNDSIAEKKDEKDGGSALLFKKALKTFCEERSMTTNIEKDDYDSFTALDGRLQVEFTSVGAEAAKGSAHESAEERTKRLENRGEDGKLRERKGGAVLCGMESPLPEGTDGTRVIRCLVDGDSAHPVGSFIGAAAYSVLQQGTNAYLGNLKHGSTCVSIVGADAGGGDDATQARVQNRKLFFSGFIVPFLFPELGSKYKYAGTTQLPVKAFRGDLDFAAAKLTTVQPNVDLGMLALLVSSLNEKGGSIGSGPVTIRDNIASSTMTTSDLAAEWNKTYGPIFTSAVGLCRTLKPKDFEALPGWLTKFIEGMTIDHYSKLFGDDTGDAVKDLFAGMGAFKGASDADRAAVLEQLKAKFENIFGAL